MFKKNIRTAYGRLVGWIDNNKAYTDSGRYLGYYDRSKDATFSPSGKLLAQGDILSALVWAPNLF